MLRRISVLPRTLTLSRRPLHSLPVSPTKIFVSEMARTMSVSFLGTSSGGGPTATRNCSSLVADVLRDGSLWMVDCGEGTLRQFALQPWRQDYLKLVNVNKIFITHMHADHVMGIITILRNLLYPPSTDPLHVEDPEKPPRIEIFGPAGIRTFIRSILSMTFTKTADKYVCHELLLPQDPVTPCSHDVLHVSEAAGQDIYTTEDGFWRSFTSGEGVYGQVIVDAAPVAHRDPCLGFVIRESVTPFRKIVILGDTYDPSAIVPLCLNPSPSLLIHEATDAHIPQSIDPKAKRPYEAIHQKALARGHSLPEMAGAFAKQVGAQKLVLNHIGGRFPAPSHRDRDATRSNVIQEIERQASVAWGTGQTARVAWDYMSVGLPATDAHVRQDREGITRHENKTNFLHQKRPQLHQHRQVHHYRPVHKDDGSDTEYDTQRKRKK